MFYALMRKDLRLLRPVIVAAVIVALFGDVVLPAVALYQRAVRIGVAPWELPAARAWVEVGGGAGIAYLFGIVLAAGFAAAGATIERRERWAEFAAMLPIARWRQALARLAVAGTLAAITCGAQAALLLFGNRFGEQRWRTYTDVQAGAFALLALGTFGFAWLAAAFLRSPAVASAIGIGVVFAGLMVATTAQQFYWVEHYPSATAPRYVDAFVVALAPTALAAIVGGTLLAARRVEP